MYMLQLSSEAAFGYDLPAVWGMKINEMIAAGQFWRLLTPIFLHGSILHIGFNMYALVIFGPMLERHFGHVRFLVLYMLSGFAGNVISLMFTIQPSLGSSTAIFGLLGGQAIFLYRNQKVFGGIAQRALSNIISVAVINLLIGLSPGIDNWGHIGGLVAGSLFAWGGGPLYRLEGVMPVFSLADEREPIEVIQAGVGVAILYIILVLANFIFWN
jgi:rhomboid protease GluP